MKLIIDIPEEEYERMKEQSMFGRVDVWKRAIKNGTPLPDHHKRLIDADDVYDAFRPYVSFSDLCDTLDEIPTIIEGGVRANERKTEGEEIQKENRLS